MKKSIGGKASSGGKTVAAKKTVVTGKAVNKNEMTRANKGKGVGKASMETGGASSSKRTGTKAIKQTKPMYGEAAALARYKKTGRV